MNNARITVCIPAYNQPELLSETLSSLCDQGLRRHEYVVAISDDASPASLADVVAGFEDKLQIVYRRQTANLGHLANFEAAFRLAATPYVSFLPHDDLIAPGQLRRALTELERDPGAVLVASLVICQRHPGAADTKLHGIFLRGSSRANYAQPYVWGQAEWMALALVTTPLSMVGSLFDADTFNRCQHWKSFPLWHDRLMMAEMGLHGRVVSLPWIGGHYRVSASQLSVQLWQPDMTEFREVSNLILQLCVLAGVPVIAFWIDQICTAQPEERILYLQMLKTAVAGDVFQQIKQESERRLQLRLHLGGRLDRIGVPQPLARFVRVLDRFLTSRRS